MNLKRMKCLIKVKNDHVFLLFGKHLKVNIFL